MSAWWVGTADAAGAKAGPSSIPIPSPDDKVLPMGQGPKSVNGVLKPSPRWNWSRGLLTSEPQLENPVSEEELEVTPITAEEMAWRIKFRVSTREVG